MQRLIDYKSRFRILKGGKISLVVSALLTASTFLNAAPSGGVVTSGSANISANGTTTNITQHTNKVTINWNKFNIASNETVNFKQPSSSSIALNRVVGNEKSIINGALNANGQVWLLNSNGILFGKSAKINTAGFLGTTRQLSDSDFNAGNYNFKGDSQESVINLGEIQSADNSYVALLAKNVENDGTIKVVKGKVHLVGANDVSINLNGNSLVNLKVNKGLLDSLVKNSGAVYAKGGEIYLTTNAVNELLKGVVNNTGILEANSFEDFKGKVALSSIGGDIVNSGSIKVSSLDSKAGKITLQADKITLENSTILDASGATQGGEIYVGGGFQGKDNTLYNALDVQVDNGAFIDASATSTGAAGQIVFWSDKLMRFAGLIKATGGNISGDGGEVEVSGKERLWFLGKTDLISSNGKNGSLLLDPGTITIVDGSSGQTGTPSDWSDNNVYGSYVIPETVLESLTGDVVLTANTDIIIEDLSDNELTLSASNMRFYSNDETRPTSAGGILMKDINDTIFLNQGSGHELVFQGGNMSSAPESASIYLGNIKTSGANVIFNTKRSRAATPIKVKGTVFTNGGNITATPGTRFGINNSDVVDIYFDGLVKTSGGNFTSNMTGDVYMIGGLDVGSGNANIDGNNVNVNIIKSSSTSTTNNKTKEIEKIITPISNEQAIIKNSIKTNIKNNITIPTEFKRTGVLVSSTPSNDTPTKLVSLSSLKQSKSTGDSTTPEVNGDVVVPLGQNSIINLVNGGVNLPSGVEQQFFVASQDSKGNN
ncbi:filamentous hemagglutinin N-terminal domain-containing protein [Arcobacter sp. CECT 8985]|uniref:two-partner secretion domain-containing protein n=1 Tax=Arcobacter sp. CECT 8985 TaxID=1935424 RepID=UPI00100BAAC6|nr:filamentous hemagglutinin N-terminal domain-containing protein [Arcobacter sp. CECT 8985]RXJ87206.1 hypothetical protein CRU93_04670 [Arcobacter sp. CECT 8985]